MHIYLFYRDSQLYRVITSLINTCSRYYLSRNFKSHRIPSIYNLDSRYIYMILDRNIFTDFVTFYLEIPPPKYFRFQFPPAASAGVVSNCPLPFVSLSSLCRVRVLSILPFLLLALRSAFSAQTLPLTSRLEISVAFYLYCR